MSQVDKILQEIYIEMEIEQLEEKIEEASILLDEQEVLQEDDPLAQKMKDLLGMKTTLKYKIQKLAPGDDDTKRALYQKMINLDNSLKALKKKAVEKGGEAVEKGKELVQKVSSSDAAEKGKEMAQGAGEAIKKGAEGAVKKGGELVKLASDNPAAAGSAAAVAAVAAGVVIYKKFFSQSARACKGKSGADKKNCVNSFKAKGLQAAKSKVLAGMSKCKDEKCKAKLKAKAQGFDAKISGLKGAVAESVINQYVDNYLSEIVDQDSKN